MFNRIIFIRLIATILHIIQKRMLNEEQRKQFEKEAIPHMDAIYNYAQRMCNDPDEAEDLVQETFLKAYRFFDKFEIGTNCKAWLFRILKNTFINKYRKDTKEPEKVDYGSIEEFYELIRDTNSNSINLEDTIFENVFDDEVSTALQRLPDEFRTVIILCDIEGMTYEEIAEFLDCPIGTVRSRLHRARNVLATTLLEYAKSKGFAKDS